jgi:alpha-tubulin suppressor-like RCC1 family protein
MACGRGSSGQLGLGNELSYNTLQPLDIGGFVIEIACGNEFSMAVVRNDDQTGNNLYMWGQGEEFQLGNMTEDDEEGESVSVPTMVDLGGRVVISARGGTSHTMFIVAAV